MPKFCIHEQHAGICDKTGSYCNEGVCPYEEMVDYAPVVHGRWIEKRHMIGGSILNALIAESKRINILLSEAGFVGTVERKWIRRKNETSNSNNNINSADLCPVQVRKG